MWNCSDISVWQLKETLFFLKNSNIHPVSWYLERPISSYTKALKPKTYFNEIQNLQFNNGFNFTKKRSGPFYSKLELKLKFSSHQVETLIVSWKYLSLCPTQRFVTYLAFCCHLIFTLLHTSQQKISHLFWLFSCQIKAYLDSQDMLLFFRCHNYKNI